MAISHAVIVTAAGSSSRFNSSSNSASKNVKKEYLCLGSHSILSLAIRPFLALEGLKAVVVTYRDGELEKVKEAVSEINDDRIFFVPGGSTRQKSVFEALSFLWKRNAELELDFVSIHDGARPFVTTDLAKSCLEAAQKTGGACPGLKVTDTLVRINESGLFEGAIPRDGVCTVQTPQVFDFKKIYQAHVEADPSMTYTDDTQIFIASGHKVAFVQGSEKNRKITYQKDLQEALK